MLSIFFRQIEVPIGIFSRCPPSSSSTSSTVSPFWVLFVRLLGVADEVKRCAPSTATKGSIRFDATDAVSIHRDASQKKGALVRFKTSCDTVLYVRRRFSSIIT